MVCGRHRSSVEELVEAVGAESSDKREVGAMFLRHGDFERMSCWRPGLFGMNPTGEGGLVYVDQRSSAVDDFLEFGSKVLPLLAFELRVGVLAIEFVESIDPFDFVFLVEVVKLSCLDSDTITLVEESDSFG